MTHSGVFLNSSGVATRGKSGATRPLLIWLLVQLAALALAAGRVPLWARFPQPGELLALQFLVAAQTAAASMCFPFLLRDRRTAACILATGWPMALIAGGLAAAPLSRICTAEAYVGLFLVVLTIWKIPLRSSMSQSCGAAVASLWTVGGAMLVYLRAEFAQGSPSLDDVLAGPLVALARAAGNSSFPDRGFLLQMGAMMVLGVLICVISIAFNPARNASRSGRDALHAGL